MQETEKALSAIKDNVTANATDIQNLQASVAKLQTDLTQMQSKYDATQKLLDETNANLETFAATISTLDIKYVNDEEELLRCQLIINGVKEQRARRPKGPYPLGDFGVIGGTVGRRRLILTLIVQLIIQWVWPIYWATGQLIAGRPPSLGDVRPQTYIKHV